MISQDNIFIYLPCLYFNGMLHALSEKRMQITKFKMAALIAIVVLAGAFSLHLVIPLLTKSLTIPASGSFGQIVTVPSSGAYQSEIRALIVHALSLINPNWDLITQTAKDYSINKLVVETMGNSFARYPGNVLGVIYAEYVLPDAIIAAHARGIELHIVMNVLADGSPGGPDYSAVRADGSLDDATICPTKPKSRLRVQNLVQEVISKYPEIDGFMFDYIRYNWDDECYCTYCRDKFIADTGLTDVNWRVDVILGGRYHLQFMEWRTKPINELVRDMRSWMLAIKPNLEFSAAVWGWAVETTGASAPAYNRYWIGQDSNYWIKEGWLDWVAPMIYTSNLAEIQASFNDYKRHMVDGPEGQIPLVPILTDCYPSVVSSDNFKQQIDLIRSLGADGWAIWRYGGPGDGQGSGAPDIRNYLSLISRPPTFTLRNITVAPSATSAMIVWTTDLPATSKVEYSSLPLFGANFVPDPYVEDGRYNYWDIVHFPGTIVEDTTAVTSHSITLTGLQPGTQYYYRVQSKDASGTATGKAFTFQL